MKTVPLLCLLLLSVQMAQATHLIGGYIQAKRVGGSFLTYEITVALYMDGVRGTVASTQASSVSLCFGDGATGLIARQNQVDVLNKAVSLSTYRTVHTYSGPGTYALTVSIANRTNVLTIPNADNQLFTLRTTISANATASNQTPTPGFPENGFHVGINQRMTLALKATDADGDSLVYGLAKPLTSQATDLCNRQTILSYQFPNDVTRQGTFKLNNRTGDLVWDAPTKLGWYSVAIAIDEYRNGSLISQTTQEIMLFVEDLPGTPVIVPPYEPAMEGAVVTATTSYADADINLTTFPSPVDDRLQVLIQTSNPTTATVQLLDVNGRKLHELTLSRPARRHEPVISMGSLVPGVYLIRADVGGRSLLRRVVKR